MDDQLGAPNEVHKFICNARKDGLIGQEFFSNAMDFIRGAELIIHNAPFDVGFIDAELKLLDADARLVASECKITDSLQLARAKHPGQRNNLDALCQRYAVDNSNRTLHGALLDAEILADVYLMMTGGQTTLGLSADDDATGSTAGSAGAIRRLPADRPKLRVISATDDEAQAHEARLDKLSEIAENGQCGVVDATPAFQSV